MLGLLLIGPALVTWLRAQDVTSVDVCGIATGCELADAVAAL